MEPYGYQRNVIGDSNFATQTIGPKTEQVCSAFSWTVIDTALSIEELAEKEKYYINLCDSIEQGYNQDLGGGFKKTVFQYTDWGLLVGEWPSLSWASLSVWGKRKSISNCCLGYSKSYKEFYWNYSITDVFSSKVDFRRKKVIQYDSIGNQIAVFNSASEASKQTGVSKTCISRCCRGE